MPLIAKKIYVEGANGETILREYWENERPKNPYAHPEGSSLQRRGAKARRVVRRRVAPDRKGYSWSMGYNHCVGQYSPGHKYSRFAGSSLNRSKQMKLYETLPENCSDVAARTRDLLAMAIKAARQYYKRGADLPLSVRNFIMRQDHGTEREFILWLSTENGGAEIGIPLYLHKLSARSRGKVKDKATAFFRASTGDRVFLTLTFIAAVDDQTGVAILNKFLTSVRKEFPKLQYLWVAERQLESTGNIHFHMVLNKRLPVRRYNALWVLAQYNSGLAGKNKFNEQVSKEEITAAFKKGTIHTYFNPLDIKRVRSIGALSNYLTKYITKQDGNSSFTCAAWHCSRRVSRMFTRATVGPSAFAYMQTFNNYRLDKTTGECFPPAMTTDKPFYVIVYAANKSAPLKYLREMEQVNKWILKGHELDRLCLIDDDVYRRQFCKN